MGWMVWVAITLGCGCSVVDALGGDDDPAGDARTFDARSFDAPTADANATDAANCATLSGGLPDRWWPGDVNGREIRQPVNASSVGTGVTITSGYVGDAFSFDGAGTGILAGNAFEPISGNFTIELWVNLDSGATGNRVIVTQWHSGGGAYQNWDIRYSWSGADNGRLHFLANADDSIYEGPTLPKGVWTHVAFVREGSSFMFYLDGVESQATLISGSPLTTVMAGTTNTGIGQAPGNTTAAYRFSGQLDEISLYKRALSTSEITAVFNAGADGKCAP